MRTVRLRIKPRLKLLQGAAGNPSQRVRFERLAHVHRELEALRAAANSGIPSWHQTTR